MLCSNRPWEREWCRFAIMKYSTFALPSEHTMRMGEKKEELEQTSSGTLYFFITIPVSQSITQRESPPQVATKRLSPAAPVSKETQVSEFWAIWANRRSKPIRRYLAGTRRPTAGWRSPPGCPVYCDTGGRGEASDAPAAGGRKDFWWHSDDRNSS